MPGEGVDAVWAPTTAGAAWVEVVQAVARAADWEVGMAAVRVAVVMEAVTGEGEKEAAMEAVVREAARAVAKAEEAIRFCT